MTTIDEIMDGALSCGYWRRAQLRRAERTIWRRFRREATLPEIWAILSAAHPRSEVVEIFRADGRWGSWALTHAVG